MMMNFARVFARRVQGMIRRSASARQGGSALPAAAAACATVAGGLGLALTNQAPILANAEPFAEMRSGRFVVPAQVNRINRASVVTVDGKDFSVTYKRSGSNTYVTIEDIFGDAKFDPCVPFCSACLCDNGNIFVSGTIGLVPGSARLVDGGVGPETTATMNLVALALEACGASVSDLTNVNIFLKENNKSRYSAMNKAYVEFFEGKPLPARITVGCGELALGAKVEIQATAYAKRLSNSQDGK